MISPERFPISPLALVSGERARERGRSITVASTVNRSSIHLRSSFTLLELVLAMAIMATIAAMAWPHLQPGVSRAGYRSAALQLKSDLAEAREQAIHHGQIQELRIKPGTGRYVIVPANQQPANDSKPKVKKSRRDGDQLAAASTGKTQDKSAELFRELPGEIVFRPPESETDSRGNFGQARSATRERQVSSKQPMPLLAADSKTERLEDVLNPDNQEWILSVRFFPDGRATEGTIDLEGSEDSREISVHVRGLTGGVSIGSVAAIDVEQTGGLEAEPQLSSSAEPTKRRP